MPKRDWGRAVRQASLVSARLCAPLHNKPTTRPHDIRRRPFLLPPHPWPPPAADGLQTMDAGCVGCATRATSVHRPSPFPRKGIILVETTERVVDPISHLVQCFLQWNQPHTRQPAPRCPRVKRANVLLFWTLSQYNNRFSFTPYDILIFGIHPPSAFLRRS